MKFPAQARPRLKLLVWLIAGAMVGVCFGAYASAPKDAADGRREPSFDLQSFVDDAIARGETAIVLPAGRHRIEPIDGIHLRLHGLRDVSIVGDDFELVCTQTTRALDISDCQGLTISGLSIDYDPLPFTQGRLVKLSADKRVHEIELLDGYPEATTATNKKYQVFNGDNSTLRWVDFFEPKVEALSAKRLRVTKTGRGGAPQERVGDWVAIGSTTDAGTTLPHAVMIASCSAVRLERVCVYASNCFAFLENDCDATEYDRCRVVRRDAESDPVAREATRLRSANADGFHSKRATTGPRIFGCYAHYQGDDCVNINGDYHLVTAARDRRLRVLAKQSMDLRVGDPVELTDRDGGVLPEVRVVAIRPAGARDAAESRLVGSLDLHASLKTGRNHRLRKAYDVLLDRPVSLEPGSLIAAANRRGDGFSVVGCDFGHVRSRGIIAKASHGEIRDNRLTACRAESIKVAPERYWLESGAASDLRIVGNTIADCGSVAIAVYARGVARGFASGSAHRQITIADNRIVRSPLPSVFVSSADAVRVVGNRSRGDAHAAPSGHALLRQLAGIEGSPSSVLLHHCHDVVMRSNTLR